MTLVRDVAAAAEREYDLVVVGGGIYGAAAAYEASRRGLATLLVERGDFGQETSWNSLRIAHGGFRYLQNLDMPRYFESVRERAWLLRSFPGEVRPLAFAMPLYDRGLRRRSLFRAAIWVNEFLSAGRNRGLPPESHVPSGRVLPREETLARFPYVTSDGLKGAGVWHDAVMLRSQRVVMELLRGAGSHGATALNYCEAKGIEKGEGRVRAVVVEDLVGRETATIRAGRVLNCAGPWVRQLAERTDRDLPSLFRRSLAFNLSIDRRPSSDHAVALTIPGRARTTYLLVPVGNLTFVGTRHEAIAPGAPRDGVPESSIVAFLEELNAAAPGLRLRREEVLRVHWGELPAAEEGSAALAVRPLLTDHGKHGGPEGLFSLSGVKFTTARLVAERAIRAIFRGHERVGGGAPFPKPAEVPRADEMRRLMAEDPDRAERIVRELATNEAVMCVEDLMLRRTEWGMHPLLFEEIAEGVSHFVGFPPSPSAVVGPQGR